MAGRRKRVAKGFGADREREEKRKKQLALAALAGGGVLGLGVLAVLKNRSGASKDAKKDKKKEKEQEKEKEKIEKGLEEQEKDAAKRAAEEADEAAKQALAASKAAAASADQAAKDKAAKDAQDAQDAQDAAEQAAAAAKTAAAKAAADDLQAAQDAKDLAEKAAAAAKTAAAAAKPFFVDDWFYKVFGVNEPRDAKELGKLFQIKTSASTMSAPNGSFSVGIKYLTTVGDVLNGKIPVAKIPAEPVRFSCRPIDSLDIFDPPAMVLVQAWAAPNFNTLETVYLAPRLTDQASNFSNSLVKIYPVLTAPGTLVRMFDAAQAGNKNVVPKISLSSSSSLSNIRNAVTLMFHRKIQVVTQWHKRTANAREWVPNKTGGEIDLLLSPLPQAIDIERGGYGACDAKWSFVVRERLFGIYRAAIHLAVSKGKQRLLLSPPECCLPSNWPCEALNCALLDFSSSPLEVVYCSDDPLVQHRVTTPVDPSWREESFASSSSSSSSFSLWNGDRDGEFERSSSSSSSGDGNIVKLPLRCMHPLPLKPGKWVWDWFFTTFGFKETGEEAAWTFDQTSILSKGVKIEGGKRQILEVQSVLDYLVAKRIALPPQPPSPLIKQKFDLCELKRGTIQLLGTLDNGYGAPDDEITSLPFQQIEDRRERAMAISAAGTTVMYRWRRQWAAELQKSFYLEHFALGLADWNDQRPYELVLASPPVFSEPEMWRKVTLQTFENAELATLHLGRSLSGRTGMHFVTCCDLKVNDPETRRQALLGMYIGAMAFAAAAALQTGHWVCSLMDMGEDDIVDEAIRECRKHHWGQALQIYLVYDQDVVATSSSSSFVQPPKGFNRARSPF